MKNARAVATGLLLMLTSSCASVRSQQIRDRIATCGDFLARWGEKPAELQFSGCKKEDRPEPNFDRLIATYTLKGTDAAKIEILFKQQYNMAPLKFRCCGWSPVLPDALRGSRSDSGSYTDRWGNGYEIVLSSDETVLNQREDWGKISQFHVTITQYLGLPN